MTRVVKRSFLLTTFLVPIFFIGMYIGIIFLTKKSFEDTHAIVYVYDQEGSIGTALRSNKNVTYARSNKEMQREMDNLKTASNNSNILFIPANFYESRQVEFLSSGKPNIGIQNEIKAHLKELITDRRYRTVGINVDSIKNIDNSITLSAKEITQNGETVDSNTEIAMGIALGLSILVYISLFLYGSQVMRGIIEEKSSRIIEIIISSVKPFQLMMGKIIGIGMVGLTQFVLWLLLSVMLAAVAGSFLVSKEELMTQVSQRGSQTNELAPHGQQAGNMEILSALQSINFPELIICFFIFFVGGYLIYSALFAAVGSAVDSETEASQFTMPITMPLLLTYALSFGVLVNDPHGTISMWLSFIPFTSPIAMLVRIPFGVPTWQIVISALLLVAGFVLTTWFAARIYRVGILMYGKKATYKELLKWFRYKN